MRQWNQGQQQAIDTRQKQVLVMASAGTGKTAVLVERVVRQLLDDQPPLAIDQVLLVTFTNAAAQEMRERISQGLTKRLEAEPNNQWIQRQLLLLGKAAISTLHAFCLDLIRQNYDVLGIDPQSRILNETEKLLWMQQVLEEVLERNYEAEKPGFISLIQRFSGEKNDEPLRKLINQVYDVAISQPFPEAWLKQATALFESFQEYDDNLDCQEIESKLTFLPMLLNQTHQQLKKVIAALENAYEQAADYPALKKYLPVFQDESNSIKEFLQVSSWAMLQAKVEEGKVVFGRLPSVSTKPLPEEAPCAYQMRIGCQEQVKDLRGQAKEEFNQLFKRLQGLSCRQMAREIHNMASAILYLADLVRDYIKEYQRLKREKAAMDFNDIEHWALSLLIDSEGKPTDLSRTINKRFQEVLVDEYQDINPMQEALLQALAQGGRLFMVGDIKQSIYGFRQAEPKLFLDKYEDFSQHQTGEIVRLADNYRSSQWVIQGINQIFDCIMTKESSGLDYQKDGRFNCGNKRPQEGGIETSSLELHIIEKESSKALEDQLIALDDNQTFDDQEVENPEGLAQEAWLAGRRILTLIQGQVWDPKTGKMRDTRFRDIVILLPAMRNVAPAFVEVFRKLGIPVYADMGTGYFGAQEIQTVVNFLKVVENPRQDIPLAALLLSPAIGFTPEDLANIRLVKAEGNLYESLVLSGRKGPKHLRLPIREFLKELKKYRQQALEDSLENLLLSFYENTGFLIIAGAMPGGNQRHANLWAMIQRARQFEENTAKGIYPFLKYLEGLEKSKSDLSPAAIIGEKDDVVRIMTIHKSKGLEFPIVFLCTGGRRFNMGSLQQDVLIHRTYGLGPAAVDPENRLKYPSGIQQMIKQVLLDEVLAEEMRLLYVAMTRAKDKLIVVGRMTKATEKLDGSRNNSKLDLNRASCFLDWLITAIGSLKEQESDWQIKIWNQEEIRQLVVEETTISPLWKLLLAEPIQAEEVQKWSKLGERFQWQYAYQAACGLPGKRSVTQAKGRLYPDQEDAVSLWNQQIKSRQHKPKFIEEVEQVRQKLSGIEKGNLLHKVLAAIDFSQGWSGENLETQIDSWLDKLVEKEYLSLAERLVVPIEPLVAFVQSPLAQRMMKANQSLHQEASFTMLVSASRLYPEVTTDDDIVLQGTIDAYFREADKIVLVDYKSDRIMPGQEDLLAKRYQGQLALYAEALTTATGIKVKEQWIYSLALNSEILVKAETNLQE